MIGKSVAHYEIVEKLGEGGMGVVYKAKDLHLGRFVAIKMLPQERVADASRKARFVQEAKAASALNHPSIITVHDVGEADGVTFIVMEYVAGKTLDQLIGRKGLPLSATLKYAIQTAGALAKAHAAGIVHRDLKPSNVMATDDGLIKVLDFGLAKLTEAPAGELGLTRTLDAHTAEGVIVGTVAYMSPEQAEGKPVDSRSDIFSFGALLYEMVTGRRAFARESAASTIAALLREEPLPITQVSSETPRDLEKIIARCLRKDPARRFQGMADVQVALEELKEESDSGALVAGAAPTRRRRPILVWTACALAMALALAAGAWFWLQRPPAGPPSLVRTFGARAGFQWGPAFSPDGKQLAFVWNGEKQDNYDIYVQLVDEATPRRLTSDPAFDFSPVWSPDALHIAFLRQSGTGTEVLIVPAAGGAERRVHVSSLPCRASMQTLARQYCGLAWSPNGKFLTIVDRASPREPGSIFLLNVETRVKRKLTTPPAGSRGDGLSVFSPDGSKLAFARFSSGYPNDIFVLALSDSGEPRGEPRAVTKDVQTIAGLDWTEDGRRLLFASNRSGMHALWQVAAAGGDPKRLTVGSDKSFWPAVSRKGNRLAYTQMVFDINIWRVEAPGAAGAAGAAAPVRITHSPVLDVTPALSPDGKKVAFASEQLGALQPWICGSDGSQPVRLSELSGGWPQWSPDGREIVFQGGGEGRTPHIQVISSEGGAARRLTTGDFVEWRPSWARDGKWVYFGSDRGEGARIWKVPAGGGSPVLVARGVWPVFESFDAKFVFYVGGPGQIWKTPAAGGEATLALKIGRRAAPLWAISASGFFVLDPDAEGGPAIEFYPFGSSQSTHTTRLGGEPESYLWGVDAVSVSADGRWIVYDHRDRYEGEIMMVENFR